MLTNLTEGMQAAAVHVEHLSLYPELRAAKLPKPSKNTSLSINYNVKTPLSRIVDIWRVSWLCSCFATDACGQDVP